MKRLCSVCVRGGSKGVPNKNTRPLFYLPFAGLGDFLAKRMALINA